MSATTRPPVPIPTSNGHANGHSSTHISDLSEGHTTTDESHIVQTKRYEESLSSRTEHRSMNKSTFTHTFTSDQQVTVLRQTVIATRSRLISELSHVDSHYIDSMTVESFLEYIECERLTHMPRRGSRWDNVLKWAEFFALQISRYEEAVHSFVPDSKNAAKMIWAASCILVEVSAASCHWLNALYLLSIAWSMQLASYRDSIRNVLQSGAFLVLLSSAPGSSVSQLAHSD